MKRVLAFVALFALCLAILFLVQSRLEPSKKENEPAPASATPAPAQTPLTEFTDSHGKSGQGNIEGAFDTRFKPPETGRLRYHVTASKVALVGDGVFELTTLKALFHDDRSEDDPLETEATAVRARARLNTERIDQAPIDETFPITLFDAVATLHKGSRFSPVTLRVPELEGTFGTRSFSSKDQVALTGRGLSASGRGLAVDGVKESLSLLENARASVEFQNGSLARLTSRGAFTAKSRPDLGPNAVEIEARDAAELKLEGARNLKVTADVVRLYGDMQSGVSERFVPTSAEAEGHVVLTPTEGVFSGARATLEFEGGQPSHAALDGEPKLDLVLRGERLERVPAEVLVEGETLTVAVRGAGPLEIFFGDDERFEFTGPATLELPAIAARLGASSSMTGTVGPDGRFHELTAFGNATFDYERAHLETEDLIVRSFFDERGRAAARVIGIGSTHVTGTLEDGRPFDLLARRGLVAERVRDGLRVPTADDVDLTVEGDKGFHAKSEHVSDFDLAALTLVAEGQVEFESERGRGRGVRLDVFGPSRGELTGEDRHPARFDFEQGSFEARYIAFDGERIQARVDAHALATMADTFHDVAARWVVIERHPLAPAPGAVVEGDAAIPGVVLVAGGDVRSIITNANESWRLSSNELRAYADESADGRFEPTGLIARGEVDFDYVGKAQLSGHGERLEVGRDRHGRLYPDAQGKVALAGQLPGTELDFDLSADQVEFAPTQLIASGFDLSVRGLDVPWQGRDAPAEERSIRAIGATLAADEGSLFMTLAYLGGKTATQGDWSFDAPFVLLTRSGEKSERVGELTAVRDLSVWGGFTAQLGQMGFASGESIQLVNGRRSATISGTPATLKRPEVVWSSTWFDLDLGSGYMRSDAGEVTAAGASAQTSWSLRYQSLEPVVTPDETIQVMRQPVLTQGAIDVRAGWAVVWLDRGELPKLSGAAQGGAVPTTTPAPAQKKPISLFSQFELGEASRWLREVYLEGEIEFRVQGERRARAEEAYFDLVDGNGWLHKVDLTVEVPFTKRADKLKVQADWLRHSVDGSLKAVNAVVTSCTFDEPHYVIKIGDFSMLPHWKEETEPPKKPGEEPRVIKKHDGWNFALENNVIASPGGFEIPMPRIAFPTNPDFEIDRDALEVAGLTIPSFGQDSKFGTFVSTSVTRDLGWVAHKVHGFLNWALHTGFKLPELPEAKGHTKYTGSYFGSRGVRGGIENEIDSEGAYHLETLFDLIYDRGEDRGLVRVPKDDRSELRAWFRTRGRYLLGDQEWLDLVLTYQTDPGVQAEFFESEYLKYEERETYLHYRGADGERQWNATLETRLEDFRTEVVDQPALGYFRGRSQIGSLGHYPLIYTSNSTLEHLARYEGELPYEQPFADGLGDRDVTRLDTTQRIETPLPLNYAGLRATPFVAGRFTGWSDNAQEDGAASRAALLAGAELATTFWRLFSSGSRHALTPSIGYRANVAESDSNLPVAQFDQVDASIDGEFVDFAVRSRWEYRELRSDLDIEVRETHANDVPAGEIEGWQPVLTRGTWLSRAFGMPFGVAHEGHYDLESGETDYSRTFFALEPHPDLDLETGYHFARDLTGDRLYDALSVGARYVLSSKWQADGDYTFSIGDNGDRLSSSLTLRRLGHDFVFEVSSSFVAGEGASSLRFNISPLLTWKPAGDSMIDRWLALRK